MNNRQLDRKNKILAVILIAIAIMTAIGAGVWFNIYAPLILQR